MLQQLTAQLTQVSHLLLLGQMNACPKDDWMVGDGGSAAHQRKEAETDTKVLNIYQNILSYNVANEVKPWEWT